MNHHFNVSQHLFAMMCNKKRKEWSDEIKKALPADQLLHMQEKEWHKFWNKLNEQPPDFKGKIVVDYGCGYGYDSLFVLKAGAQHVYCLDVELNRLEDSERLHKTHGFQNATYIDNSDIDSLPTKIGEKSVDILFSRNVMEHVPKPKNALKAMYGVLKPGGVAYIGTAPLYKSPFGPHFSGKCKVPWVHLMFSEETILSVFKELYHLPESVEHFQDIPGSGVNKMSYYQYRDMFHSFDWDIDHEYVNRFTGRDMMEKAVHMTTALIPFKAARELIIFNSYVKLIKKQQLAAGGRQ